MVNYAQLRNLDTSKLTAAAETAETLSRKLNGHGSQLGSAAQIPSGMWHGDDSQAASSMMQPLSGPLFDVSDNAGKSKGVLEDLVGDLAKAKAKLDDAHDLAAGTGITISQDGAVTTPEVKDLATYESNERTAQQVRQTIDEAVQLANDADDTASGSLASSVGDVLGAPGSWAWNMYGPDTGGALKGAAWGPWAATQFFGRSQDIGKWYNKLIAPNRLLGFDQHAPISRLQKTPSDKYLKSANRHKDLTRVGKTLNAQDKWAKWGKFANRAGSVAAVGGSLATQAAEDWGNKDMSNVEKGTRSAYRGGVQGGSAIAGAKMGAAAGAWAGTFAGPVGTVAGAVVGGVVGGVAGSKSGGMIVDGTVDAVGNAGDAVGDAVGSGLKKINPFD